MKYPPEFVHKTKDPLAQVWLTTLRNIKSDPREFNHAASVVIGSVIADASADLGLRDRRIRTPLAAFRGKELAEDVTAIFVSGAQVLREPFTDRIPESRIGLAFIDEGEVVSQIDPPQGLKQSTVYLFDLGLATGKSMDQLVSRVKEHEPHRVKVLNLISADEGLKYLYDHQPDITVFTGDIDEEELENGLIVPGFGNGYDRSNGKRYVPPKQKDDVASPSEETVSAS